MADIAAHVVERVTEHGFIFQRGTAGVHRSADLVAAILTNDVGHFLHRSDLVAGKHDVLEVVGALVAPLILHPVDDTALRAVDVVDSLNLVVRASTGGVALGYVGACRWCHGVGISLRGALLPAIWVVGTAHVVGLGAQILLIADDDAFALAPGKAVIVVVDGVLQSPCFEFAVSEISISTMNCGIGCFAQGAGTIGTYNDVKRVACRLSLGLCGGCHIVGDAVVLSGLQRAAVAQCLQRGIGDADSRFYLTFYHYAWIFRQLCGLVENGLDLCALLGKVIKFFVHNFQLFFNNLT